MTHLLPRAVRLLMQLAKCSFDVFVDKLCCAVEVL